MGADRTAHIKSLQKIRLTIRKAAPNLTGRLGLVFSEQPAPRLPLTFQSRECNIGGRGQECVSGVEFETLPVREKSVGMQNRFRSVWIALAALLAASSPALAAAARESDLQTCPHSRRQARSQRHLAGHEFRQLGHPAARYGAGPVASLAADFAVPPGIGIVEGGRDPLSAGRG